ncbi:MAG: MBL fold metallo-hydrolase [Myxococcota bacterium]
MSELILIGTSDAFGGGGRRQSAYLLRGPSGSVLLDCGGTTSTGLASLSISREEIEAILLTHFHADHFSGVPLFLLGAEYEDSRRSPLRIAGPVGVEERVREAARALGHPIESHRFGFPVEFEELPAGETRPIGPVEARAFRTFHSPDSRPHGLVIQSGNRRLAYSGDTGWFEALPGEVNGADLFLCECTQVRREFEYHLSLEELAERNGVFDCGQLLLTHLGQEMRRLDDFGGFEVADDGRILKL